MLDAVFILVLLYRKILWHNMLTLGKVNVTIHINDHQLSLWFSIKATRAKCPTAHPLLLGVQDSPNEDSCAFHWVSEPHNKINPLWKKSVGIKMNIGKIACEYWMKYILGDKGLIFPVCFDYSSRNTNFSTWVDQRKCVVGSLQLQPHCTW